MDKKRVVILGGSFAGLNAAKQLTSHRLDVTVVDPSSHFTWTPNIHEMLSGINAGTTCSSLANICSMAWATALFRPG